MAERVGFEPTVRFPVRSLSRRVLSTAQSPLRGRELYFSREVGVRATVPSARIAFFGMQVFERSLAAGGEEGLEKGTRFFGQDARGDFDLMIQLGASQYFEASPEGAPFWVISSINHAPNAGLDDSPGTHGTRLESHVERRIG